jgi:hypothetical protein
VPGEPIKDHLPDRFDEHRNSPAPVFVPTFAAISAMAFASDPGHP